MGDGDLETLACALGVADDHLESILSKFKKREGQAFQLLYWWHSKTNASKQTLGDILTATGYHKAAEK